MENSNQRVEKLMEEVFSMSVENSKAKEEVKKKDELVNVKEEIIQLKDSEIRQLNEEINIRTKKVETYEEQKNLNSEMIKQLELELSDSKKKISEQKQQLEESEAVLTKSLDDMSNRLYKMGVNYMKTGKITDQELPDLNLGSIEEMDETKILMLEIKKYKDMVKCPTCDQNKCIKLKCKHTY